MIAALIVLAVLLLLANATFVGAEFATVASRRPRLQAPRSARGDKTPGLSIDVHDVGAALDVDDLILRGKRHAIDPLALLLVLGALRGTI